MKPSTTILLLAILSTWACFADETRRVQHRKSSIKETEYQIHFIYEASADGTYPKTLISIRKEDARKLPDLEKLVIQLDERSAVRVSRYEEAHPAVFDRKSCHVYVKVTGVKREGNLTQITTQSSLRFRPFEGGIGLSGDAREWWNWDSNGLKLKDSETHNKRIIL